ncbi:MAG: hypothetical protein WCS15_10760, partial [Prevotella sp.]
LALCIKRESKGNKFLSQKGLSENKSVFTKHWFSEIRLFCNGEYFGALAPSFSVEDPLRKSEHYHPKQGK